MNIYENIENYFSLYFDGAMNESEEVAFLDAVHNDEALLNEFNIQLSIEESIHETAGIAENDEEYKTALLEKLGFIESQKPASLAYILNQRLYFALPVAAFLVLYFFIAMENIEEATIQKAYYYEEEYKSGFPSIANAEDDINKNKKAVNARDAESESTQTGSSQGTQNNEDHITKFTVKINNSPLFSATAIKTDNIIRKTSNRAKIRARVFPEEEITVAEEQLGVSLEILYNFPANRIEHNFYGSDAMIDDLSFTIKYRFSDWIEAGINFKEEVFLIKDTRRENSEFYETDEFTISLTGRVTPFKFDMFAPYGELYIGRNNEALVVRAGAGIKLSMSESFNFLSGFLINTYYFDKNHNLSISSNRTFIYTGINYTF